LTERLWSIGQSSPRRPDMKTYTEERRPFWKERKTTAY